MATAFALGLASAPVAHAKAVRVDAVEVELVADRDALVAGQPIRLGLRIRHDPKWHTYWRNPGDSGLPTLFEPTLPAGFSLAPIEWPAPSRIAVGPLTNYGYDGDLVLPMPLQLPANLSAREYQFAGKAQWLVCKDVCIPGEAQLSLTLPVANSASASAWSSLFETMAARTPQRTATADVALAPGERLLVALPAGSGPGQFFPYGEGLIRAPAPQPMTRVAQDTKNVELMALALAEGVDANRLDAAKFFSAPSGVLVRDGLIVELQARRIDAPAAWVAAAGALGAVGGARAAGASGTSGVAGSAGSAGATAAASAGASASAQGDAIGASLGVALVFAAIGGLILNLMPCVFPVVGLKVLGFVGDRADGSGRARSLRLAGAFVAGVFVSFWLLASILLALRGTGQALGWGFQLQSPAFVVAMALLFLVIGLNLSGVFEFGLLLTRIGNYDRGAHDLLGSFGSGCIAVLVATPCTAPFMGSALGYVMSQPPLPTLAVFTVMAAGMALPYLLLAAFPAWMRWLPRPGRWMVSMRQFLAFPMYATAVWLAWVLALQVGVDSLLPLGLSAVLLSMAAWLYGRFVQAAPARSPAALGLTVIALAAGVWLAARAATAVDDGASGATASSASTASGSSAASSASTAASVSTDSTPSAGARGPGRDGAWQAWSEAALAQAIAQRKPVFVDFTAAWCVTCQANKKLVLERAAVVEAMNARGVVRMRADWTLRNPDISAALARFGRNGVPVYALYMPDAPAPRLLPELLTQSIVIDALGAPK